MNWGVKITIAFILFVTFIMYLVVRSFQQEFNLVSETYYMDEINYQDRIDQKTNLKALGDQVKISYDIIDSVFFEFPSDHVDASGEIYFYHVSRDRFDKRFDIRVDASARQNLEVEHMVAGRYRVKLSWEAKGKKYYQESEIFIK